MSYIYKAIKSELANLALKQGAHPRLIDGQQFCRFNLRNQTTMPEQGYIPNNRSGR